MSVPNKFRLFSKPALNYVSSGNDRNLIRLTPKNGTEYIPDTNAVIDFQVGTQSDYIDKSSMAIKYKILPYNGTHANLKISGAGGSAVLNRYTLEAAGHQIEDVPRYNLYCASKRHFSTDEERKMAKTLEAYTGTSAGSVITAGTTGTTIVHKLQGGFFEHREGEEKMLAAPFFRGGMNLKYYLESPGNVLLDSTAGSYKITDVELIAKTLAVPPDYQAQVIQQLESGANISTPYQAVRSVSAVGNGATELDINIPTGFNSSIREVWVRARDNTTMTTQANDKFCGKFSNVNLDSFYLEYEGQVYPQGKPFQYKAEADPETLFLLFQEEGKAPVSYTSGDFFLKIKLSEDAFGSGVSTLSTGNIRLHLSATSAIPATTVFDVFILTDRINMLNKEWVQSVSKF